MQDENHGYDVKILDVSDVSNITVISTFNSGVDPQSMAHNGIIKDNYVYIPYYPMVLEYLIFLTQIIQHRNLCMIHIYH